MEEATISKGRSERGGMRGGMRGMRSRSPRGGFRGGYRGGRERNSGGSFSRMPSRDSGYSPRGYRDGPPMRDTRRPISPVRERGMNMRDSRGPISRSMGNGREIGGMSRDRGIIICLNKHQKFYPKLHHFWKTIIY